MLLLGTSYKYSVQSLNNLNSTLQALPNTLKSPSQYIFCLSQQWRGVLSPPAPTLLGRDSSELSMELFLISPNRKRKQAYASCSLCESYFNGSSSYKDYNHMTSLLSHSHLKKKRHATQFKSSLCWRRKKLPIVAGVKFMLGGGGNLMERMFGG